jgi:hypothetical protein
MAFFESPLSLLAACLLLFLTGVGVLLALRSRSGSGAWLIRAAAVLFLADIVVAARGISWSGGASGVRAWFRGWVLPPDQVSAMTLGLSLDPKAVVMSLLAVFLLGLFIVDPRQSGRLGAAAAIGASGLALTWSAATPWMALFGITICLLGGYLPLGFDEAADSQVASQYAWQRAGALLLATFGATSLAGGHAPWILFDDSINVTGGWAEAVAGWLLAFGLFLVYQPFPLLSWSAMPSRLSSHARLLMSHVFPGLAVFFLLAGSRKELTALQVFPAFGWIALCSGLLAIVAGLYHASREAGLRAWLAGAGALATACLALGGSDESALGAFAIYLAACLAALALSAGVPREKAEPSTEPSGLGLRIGVFLAIAAGTGVIGFVSAGSWSRFLAVFLDRPIEAFCIGLVYLAFVVLAWKLAFEFIRAADSGKRHWVVTVLPYVFSLASLGLFWRGSLSGGALSFDGDAVLSSVLDRVFAVGSAGDLDAATAATAAGICGGLFVLGAILGSWLSSGKPESHFAGWRKTAPRATKFIADDGFGMTPLAESVHRGIERAGTQVEKWIDQGVWERAMPRALFFALEKCAGALTRVSERIAKGIAGGVRAAAEVPGKVLQLTQTGDVQWYLFFGLGTGVLICLYFLRG